jgi:hypothetical protein
MVLQTTTVDRQWLGIDNVATLTDTNGTVSLQRSEGVFYAVHAEMLQAGPVEVATKQRLVKTLCSP